MWILEQYPGYERRSRRLEKKHRRELEAVLDNLDTYLVFLNQGTKPMQLVKESFVRNEPMGIHAIDQSPLGKGYKELRLYVYPDTDTSTLHVITVGDKIFLDQGDDPLRQGVTILFPVTGHGSESSLARKEVDLRPLRKVTPAVHLSTCRIYT